MPPPRARRPPVWSCRCLAVLPTVLLAACGRVPAGATVTCPPRATLAPGPSPSSVVGAVSVVVSGDGIAPGQSVDLAATVHGPVRVAAPCEGPARLLVLDAAGFHVFNATPPAGHEPCGEVDLAAGETARYDIPWTPDATLPSGRYEAVVIVGDLPGVGVGVTLAPRPGEGCRTVSQ